MNQIHCAHNLFVRRLLHTLAQSARMCIRRPTTSRQRQHGAKSGPIGGAKDVSRSVAVISSRLQPQPSSTGVGTGPRPTNPFYYSYTSAVTHRSAVGLSEQSPY